MLAQKNPRIVVCDISGYGDDGPYREKKAYDLLIQAEGGFLSVTGSPDAPAKAGKLDRRHRAGMYALQSVMAGLIQRDRTGRGARYDIAMLECMAEWMGLPTALRLRGRRAAAAGGRVARHDLSLRPVPDRRWAHT